MLSFPPPTPPQGHEQGASCCSDQTFASSEGSNETHLNFPEFSSEIRLTIQQLTLQGPVAHRRQTELSHPPKSTQTHHPKHTDTASTWHCVVIQVSPVTQALWELGEMPADESPHLTISFVSCRSAHMFCMNRLTVGWKLDELTGWNASNWVLNTHLATRNVQNITKISIRADNVQYLLKHFRQWDKQQICRKCRL